MNQHHGKQINLNDIIEYIEKNINFISKPEFIKLNNNDIEQKENFIPLVYQESKEVKNLPTNLNSIFNTMVMFRKGVIAHVGVPLNVNISYISSILSILIPDFNEMKKTKQIKFVEIFIKKIYRESREQYETFEYKNLGWVKKEFRNNIQKYIMGRDIMKYVADYLHINIFLLDISNDTLVYIGERTYIKYKKNIFLLKVDDITFEPLQFEENSIIDHNTPIINKLINSRFLVEYMDCNLSHDEEFNFIVGSDDLFKYTKDDIKKDDTDVDNCMSDDMNGFEEEKNVKYNKKYDIADSVTDIVQSTEELNDNDEAEQKVDSSYTVVQLKDIAKSRGILLSYKLNGKNKGKTKGMLIDEINNI
jgi:hypothetical protein